MLVEANVEGCAFQLSSGLASHGDKLLVKLMTVAGGLKSISDKKNWSVGLIVTLSLPSLG